MWLALLPDFSINGGNVVAGDVEQPPKSFGLFVRMHIDPHCVFDLSLVLQKLSMTSTTMEILHVVKLLSVVVYDVDQPAWAR